MACNVCKVEENTCPACGNCKEHCTCGTASMESAIAEAGVEEKVEAPAE